ncbi:MAG: hypothetical protein NTV43_08450 [Methylococcales bacterium]|nr:hypothetical protein [Methylococcales bacterium]
MKKLATLLIILSCTTLIACGKGQEINGHTTKTAYRSVKALKNRLPPDTRIEFEVSFWTVRDANKDDSEFLDKVDGKTPAEIIELGKAVYQARKAENFKEYQQFSSWEEMIAKFGKERLDQDNRKIKPADNKPKPDDSVLYKL